MPYVPYREKEDFSRVQHEPMWLLPCRHCGKEFKITSGQILGFADLCPDCAEREAQGLPPVKRTVAWWKLALVLAGVLVVLGGGAALLVALLF